VELAEDRAKLNKREELRDGMDQVVCIMRAQRPHERHDAPPFGELLERGRNVGRGLQPCAENGAHNISPSQNALPPPSRDHAAVAPIGRQTGQQF
jgi:hypothetical protein